MHSELIELLLNFLFQTYVIAERIACNCVQLLEIFSGERMSMSYEIKFRYVSMDLLAVIN